MRTLYVASTESFSGKSGITLCLALMLQRNGLRVGFMKPLSTVPSPFEGVAVDEDAYWIWKYLELTDSLKDVSPVALTPGFIEEAMGNERMRTDIEQSFHRVAKDKDVVLLEGAEDLHRGRFLGLSASQSAELLDAQVLLIGKAESDSIIDEVLIAQDFFGKRLIGVILNYVPGSHLDAINRFTVPALEGKGVKIFGIVPEDKMLKAVTIGEIVEQLGGKILCAEERVDELVEEFMVGAMSQEHALRYFRRKPNKAVITGGDRADVQLAALETPTKCVILTGGFSPIPIVLSRAEDLGIPMILVEMDTYTAVDRMEALIGHVSMHEERRVKHLGRLLKARVAMKELFGALGLSQAD